MTNHDTKLLQDLVSQYATAIGLGPLLLDETGRCSLLFDDRLSLTLESQPDTGALILSAELGPLPAQHEGELCRRMLEGNHHWQHTGGIGTLALLPQTETGAATHTPRTAALLYQTPLQSLDYGTFQNRLTDFIETAEAWMDFLSTFDTEAEAEASATSDYDNAPSSTAAADPFTQNWQGSPMIRV